MSENQEVVTSGNKTDLCEAQYFSFNAGKIPRKSKASCQHIVRGLF